MLNKFLCCAIPERGVVYVCKESGFTLKSVGYFLQKMANS